MITATTTLDQLAFIVCTALETDGTTAILSGGGADTVYAPDAYQSRDLDFIFEYWSATGTPSVTPLLNLGFVLNGQSYTHPMTHYTVDFPVGPLAIGIEKVVSWDTLRRGHQVLHILSPTDCVRDRLAWFLFNNGFGPLRETAVSNKGRVERPLAST